MKLDDVEALSPSSTPPPVVRSSRGGGHRDAEFVASVGSPEYITLSDSDEEEDGEMRKSTTSQSMGGSKTPALWEVISK